MVMNTRIVLARRPEGEPTDECFRIESEQLPELAENQILIKVCWLSLDPYMRPRMNDMKSYTKPTQIGDVMTGESSGIVVESRSEKFRKGDRVAAHLGWQSPHHRRCRQSRGYAGGPCQWYIVRSSWRGRHARQNRVLRPQGSRQARSG